MAINRADGIGHFTSAADWGAKGHNGGGFTTWHTSGGRGNRGYFSVGLNSPIHYVLTAAKTTVYHHFAFRPGARAGTPGFCEFRNAGCTQVVIIGQEDGSLAIYRADSLFGAIAFNLDGAVLLGVTAPGVFFVGVWHQMQVKCTISNTVGEVTIIVDGDQKISLTGVDTYNGNGAASTSQIGFNDCNGVANNQYGDLLVDDAKLWGDVSVYELVQPTDGDELVWGRKSPDDSGTWSSHVNSNPQNGDATYLRSSANGDRNCFFMPNVDSTIGIIIAFKATVCHRKEDPAYGAIKVYTRSDDDIDHDTETQTCTESYHFSERIFETDPKDGTVLASLSAVAAAARLNATQIGLVNVS